MQACNPVPLIAGPQVEASLIPVERRPPPLGVPLLLRLRDGQFLIARIARLSPDPATASDCDGVAYALPGRRHYLHVPWEANEHTLGIEGFAPFYSDANTHWIPVEQLIFKETP